MTRSRFIVGNWKMHKTPGEAARFVYDFCHDRTFPTDVDIGLAPPLAALQAVRDALDPQSTIRLGAQNFFWEIEGAFTGEVSAPMLVDLGCRFVIVGHSERRRIFMESDDLINNKVKAALAHGLGPILCVGETLEERDKGRTYSVVQDQVVKGLVGVAQDHMPSLTIAYEPIWAIGTGRSATVQQAEEVHGFIRGILTSTWQISPETVRILYGGSMSPGNAGELFQSREIDGGLVGKACLNPDSFATICRLASASHA